MRRRIFFILSLPCNHIPGRFLSAGLGIVILLGEEHVTG